MELWWIVLKVKIMIIMAIKIGLNIFYSRVALASYGLAGKRRFLNVSLTKWGVHLYYKKS